MYRTVWYGTYIGLVGRAYARGDLFHSLLPLVQSRNVLWQFWEILFTIRSGNIQKVKETKTSASVELTQPRHSHSKQLFQGGQISVFLQGGSKSFIRCL